MRVPSGRAGDSTLTTVAPAAASRRAHSGPAHIDDRSTTSRSAIGVCAVVPCRVTTGSHAVNSPNTAAGMSSSLARATKSAAERVRAASAIMSHGSPTSARSNSAGTASKSSSRISVKAHQSSAVGSSLVAPPDEILDGGPSPSSAARPEMISHASTLTGRPPSALTRSWIAALTSHAWASTPTGIANNPLTLVP